MSVESAAYVKKPGRRSTLSREVYEGQSGTCTLWGVSSASGVSFVPEGNASLTLWGSDAPRESPPIVVMIASGKSVALAERVTGLVIEPGEFIVEPQAFENITLPFVGAFSHDMLSNLAVDIPGSGPEAVPLPKTVEKKLDELRRLPSNWDGYGASPVSPVAFQKTRKLLLHLYSMDLSELPFPFIAPDPEGGLGLELDFGHGREMLLTVSGNGTLTYVLDMGQEDAEPTQATKGDLKGIGQIFDVMVRGRSS